MWCKPITLSFNESMKRQYALGTFLLLICSAVSGGNILKEAKEAIKNGSNLEQTETKLLEAIKTEDNVYKKLDFYYYAALLNRKINDQENEKLYLKQAYDTARFFNSIFSVFHHMGNYDSIVNHLQSERKIRKYRQKALRLLEPYQENLLNGGKFYFMKHDFARAYDFFDCYLKATDKGFFTTTSQDRQALLVEKISRWATSCGYKLQDPKKVLAYSKGALGDSAKRHFIYEYRAKAYLQMRDTASWLNNLKEGLRCNPDYSYFFASLTDYLNASQRYDEALQLADTMLSIRPRNTFFWYAKSVVLMNLKRYEECITAADSAIAYDSIYMYAYYNKGLAFCNLAVNMSDSAAAHINQEDYQDLRQRSVAYYAQALRPMEIVRVLAPKDTLRWAQPLYRIYLNLNMGAQFAQIENILKNFKNK